MNPDGKTSISGLDTRISRRSLLLSLPAVAAARKVLTAQGGDHVVACFAVEEGRIDAAATEATA